MLPQIELDQENFEQIMEEARSRISGICPEWTDFNYHDPGITILELFAWLKEIQQFHMDQVGPLHIQKFLKLLHITPKEAGPSRMKLYLASPKPVFLREGARFYAGDVCFETEVEEQTPGGRIRLGVSEGREGSVSIDGRQLPYDGRLRFYPFGRRPELGNVFYLCMENPFISGIRYRLSVLLYDGYAVRRNRIEENMPVCLTDVEAEVLTDSGWSSVSVMSDETQGFLQSGRIEMRVSGRMKKAEMYGGAGYWLRFVLKDGEYDVAPAITGISASHICLCQRKTRAASCHVKAEKDERGRILCRNQLSLTDKNIHFYRRIGARYYPYDSVMKEMGDDERMRFILGSDAQEGDTFFITASDPECDDRLEIEATGFPDQEYPIEESFLIPSRFGILVEDILEPGAFRRWERVEDFDSSKPDSLHYVLDSESRTLRFGNGIHGMIPEGNIRITDLCFTMGKQGNVRSHQITAADSELSGVRIVSFMDASGGCDRENAQNCFKRFCRQMEKSDRAVSAQDYERLVRQVPGLMIQSCRVMDDSDNSCVRIAVRPFSEGGKASLSEAYRKNIEIYLDKRRLIGTKIVILPPEYVEIRVYAEVRIQGHYLEARETVEREIREFFREQEQEFGKPVLRGRLYGRIDSLSCVEELLTLNIEARGDRINRSKSGDVYVPQNGVLFLQTVQCNAVNG